MGVAYRVGIIKEVSQTCVLLCVCVNGCENSCVLKEQYIHPYVCVVIRQKRMPRKCVCMRQGKRGRERVLLTAEILRPGLFHETALALKKNF